MVVDYLAISGANYIPWRGKCFYYPKSKTTPSAWVAIFSTRVSSSLRESGPTHLHRPRTREMLVFEPGVAERGLEAALNKDKVQKGDDAESA